MHTTKITPLPADQIQHAPALPGFITLSQRILAYFYRPAPLEIRLVQHQLDRGATEIGSCVREAQAIERASDALGQTLAAALDPRGPAGAAVTPAERRALAARQLELQSHTHPHRRHLEILA